MTEHNEGVARLRLDNGSESVSAQSRGLDVDRLARAIRAAKAEYPGLFVDWAAASEHTCRAIAAEYARLAATQAPETEGEPSR